jgi:hypothetical protein
MPGSGDRSGAVVAIAWIPGFSSAKQKPSDAVAIVSYAAAVSLMIFTSR